MVDWNANIFRNASGEFRQEPIELRIGGAAFIIWGPVACARPGISYG